MALELEACQTKHREYQYNHNIELSSDQLDELGLEEGDQAIAKNHRVSPYPACHGRVHLQDDFEEGEVGLGYTLRYATATPEGEEVTIEPIDKIVAEQSLLATISDRIFGKRPVICRVRMAVEPDPGFRVARISDETKELLGITYGDRLVIESPYGRANNVKALPQEGKPEEIKKTQKLQNDERYPSCFDHLDIEGVRGTKVDIPEIYIDRDIRGEVGIINDSTECIENNALEQGVCQPVVVYRDTTTLFRRVSQEIAMPLVIGAVVAAVGFETSLLQETFSITLREILLSKLLLLLIALFIAIGAVWYRTRVILLD